MKPLCGIDIIRKLIKVIVEKMGGYWFASFEDQPQISFGGKTPELGIEKLLSHFGNDRFGDELATVAGSTEQGYLEVMIRLRHRRLIPVPSMN
ncbi:hypothetical protein [Schlesneria paludicola]|uniref:hypothetical protein n=1 Tax=Schlesneria paludicola TaxID=360056 RepID=UPI00029B5057|nr:hypothetical protein [Schlesneria paludicola]